MKLSDAQKDYYRKLAKEEGYRSRSAFKLIQLNKAYRILKPGYSVVDLGCAPGGWLQVARTAVSQSGKVIGVDIEIRPHNRAALESHPLFDLITLIEAGRSDEVARLARTHLEGSVFYASGDGTMTISANSVR